MSLSNPSTGPGGGPEKPELVLGFIPLTDCAPLAIAAERGHFAAYGLSVRLSREPSWANIRDKLCCGMLDGAQMLAAMPLALSLGGDAFRQPVVTALSLSLNGNAITVSEGLYRRMLEADPGAMAQAPVSAAALRKVIEADRCAGREPLRFATVFPFSSHNYLLRYWLASAGIDPDRDLRLSVVPPPAMTESLRAGRIDGYCVGEPWSGAAVAEGAGRIVIASCEIWNNHPEKVLGVTREWAEAHPASHRALLMALIEACHWLDQPENRAEAARILAGPAYLDASEAVVAASLGGRVAYAAGEVPRAMPDFHVFHRYAANFPWLSHGEWLITQMLRWGQLPPAVDIKRAAAEVYRPDLYRQAALALGLPCPPGNSKPEGMHESAWLLATAAESFEMGADRFFDRRVFDPEQPLAYLEGFATRTEPVPPRSSPNP